MVNALNLSQIYAAGIDRSILDSSVDGELKGGQMTLSLGSNRLIGRFAFRNTQQSYVGLEGRLRENHGDWELVTFANVPERLLPTNQSALLANEAVWNRPMTDSYFLGYFLTKHLTAQDRVESYFYDLEEASGTIQGKSAHTPGLRIYRDVVNARFDYEVETVGQWGHAPLGLGETGPSATFNGIMEHIQVGYTWDVLWKPRLAAEWDYASANFNPLFGISVIDFGPSGILQLFNRTNIDSPAMRFLINPNEDVFVYLIYRDWWLANARAPAGWTTANLADPTGRSGSHLGETLEIAARWDLFYNLAFQAGWQMLMKGRFAEDAPGAPTNHSDVNYFYVESQFRI
jgi:hypothetical protein